MTALPPEQGPLSIRDPKAGQKHAVARIAHRAGNDRAALQVAVEGGVDWIEIDVWYSFGRLIARHEPGFWRLPVVYDGWRPRLITHRTIYLDEVIQRTEGGPRLLIDLKGRHRHLPGAIVATLRRYGAEARAAVCGQYWPPLDAIGRTEPRIALIHSLGLTEHVEAYRLRARAEPRSAGVSIAWRLVSPELLYGYHHLGLKAFAWTVNEPEVASRLAAWGVDGIISDRKELLDALP